MVKLKTVAFLCLLTFFVKAQQSRAFEFWSSQGISQRLDYGLELSLESEERLSTRSVQTFATEQIAPSLIWHYSPRYDFQLGYEGEIDWDADGKSEADHRAVTGVLIKFPWGKWNLSAKQRFDAGDREGKIVSDFRETVRLESTFFSERWTPFLSNELFFSFVSTEIEENRAQVGLLYRWNRMLETELYGMRRDLWEMETDQSTYGLILGLNLRMKF